MDRTLRRYADAGLFLRRLRDAIELRQITRQQALTLKGQALSGDVDGAERGLSKILYKGSMELLEATERLKNPRHLPRR